MNPLSRSRRRGSLWAETLVNHHQLTSTPYSGADEITRLQSEIADLRGKLVVADQAVDDLKWLDKWRTVEIHRNVQDGYVMLYWDPTFSDCDLHTERQVAGRDLATAVAAARRVEAELKAKQPYRSPSRLDQAPRTLHREGGPS